MTLIISAKDSAHDFSVNFSLSCVAVVASLTGEMTVKFSPSLCVAASLTGEMTAFVSMYYRLYLVRAILLGYIKFCLPRSSNSRQ